MADDAKDPKIEPEAEAEAASEAVPEKPPRFPIKAISQKILAALAAVGRLLPKLGLYLFMILLPLAVAAYPAYLIAARLLDYSADTPLEATFTGFDINKVPNPEGKSSLFKPKGHIEVTLFFRDAGGKKYLVVLNEPWSAPGLKREIEDQFQDGDTFALHLIGGRAYLEEDLAKDRLILLTSLMGLVFVASLLFFLIRKRLSARMPEAHIAAMNATARSVIFGQFMTLLAAAVLTSIIAYRPMLVPVPLYLGAYWGLAVLLMLSLRLLVFQDPSPPKPAAVEDDDLRAARKAPGRTAH